MLFYAATGALWPFMGEIGRTAHLTTREIGSVLGMSQIAGAAVGLLPLALGTKVGRSIPLGAGLAIGTCSIASLVAFHSSAVYWIAVPLFMSSLMIFFPYIMGVMAKLDPSGRLSTVSFALQSVGLAVGPAVAGRLAMTHGYVAVLWTGLGCFPLAFFALAPVTISQDRELAERGIGVHPL
jgi:MFS family permease